jgi:nucleotide-binding universal stress UspA family protein
MFKYILMPTDGSASSQAAVRQGLQIARENGAEVTFLNVGAPFHMLALDVEALTETRQEYERHARERGERVLAECEKAARAAGVTSRGRFTLSEHPYEEIVKTATDARADLIVMASHAHNAMQGVLLGSQTLKTLFHSGTPVLVVR